MSLVSFVGMSLVTQLVAIGTYQGVRPGLGTKYAFQNSTQMLATTLTREQPWRSGQLFARSPVTDLPLCSTNISKGKYMLNKQDSTCPQRNSERGDRRPQRMSNLATAGVLLAVLAGATACGADYSPSYTVPVSSGGPAPAASEDVASTITGHVTVRGTGAPYPGAVILFRNIFKAEMHTESDTDGAYSITLPPGVYTAFALSLKDMNAGFVLVDPSDSPVKVPTSDEVDFEAYALR
jgi:hypothetical protein